MSEPKEYVPVRDDDIIDVDMTVAEMVARWEAARINATGWAAEEVKLRDELLARVGDHGGLSFGGIPILRHSRSLSYRLDGEALRHRYPDIHNEFYTKPVIRNLLTPLIRND